MCCLYNIILYLSRGRIPKHEYLQLRHCNWLIMSYFLHFTALYFLFSEPAAPAFDSEHLQRQIEAGGGVVLPAYNGEKMREFKCCFLVSDSHQRTQKYLHCLAAGVPCVSHLWLRDCCNTVSSFPFPIHYFG